MRRRRRWSALLIGVVLLFNLGTIVVLAAHRAGERSRTARASKVVQSLAFAIEMYLNEAPDVLERRLASGASWRSLDPDECLWLVDEVARRNDIPPEWKALVLNDTWGTPLRMDVRRVTDGLEFRLTTAGPDRQFATADDFTRTTGKRSAVTHGATTRGR